MARTGRQRPLRFVRQALKRAFLSRLIVTVTAQPNGPPQRIPVVGGTGTENRIPGEPWMKEALAALVPRYPGAFYDVGANLGQTLLKLHTLSNPPSYVAFEPNPRCVDYLQRLAEANGWSEGQVVPVAVADREGMAQLNFHGATRTGSGASLLPYLSGQTSHRESVPLMRLTTVMADLELTPPGIVKLDIEGAEAAALAGMGSLLRDRAPALIIEILPSAGRDGTAEAILDHLDAAGYVLLRIEKTARDGISELVLASGAPAEKRGRDHLAVPRNHVDAVRAALAA